MHALWCVRQPSNVLSLQYDISCDSQCVSYCRLAEGYYKQALQMFESAYGEESPQVLKVRRYLYCKCGLCTFKPMQA